MIALSSCTSTLTSIKHTCYTGAAQQSMSAVGLALSCSANGDAGNPQDQQDRDIRRNMKYERDTAVAELVLGVCVCLKACVNMSLCVSDLCLCACAFASVRASVCACLCMYVTIKTYKSAQTGQADYMPIRTSRRAAHVNLIYLSSLALSSISAQTCILLFNPCQKAYPFLH